MEQERQLTQPEGKWCPPHSLSNAVEAWACLHLSGCTSRDSFRNCLLTSSIAASNLRFNFSYGFSLKAHRILQRGAASQCCILLGRTAMHDRAGMRTC